jgi:hypothetical protein
MNVAKVLIREYPEVKREVMENFTNIARMTYTNISKEDPALLRGVSQAAFVERYLKAVKAFMPSPEEIEQDTYFRWSLREIALPEEDRRQAIINAAIKPEEKDRIRALNRAVEVALATTKDDLQQFEIDVNQQLYSVVYNASEMAFRYLKASGTIPPKMSLMLDRLGEQVRGLNVMDNKEVATWAEDLRQSIQALRAATAGDKDDAYESLKSVVEVARNGASKRLARYGGVIRMAHTNEPRDEKTESVERRRRTA